MRQVILAFTALLMTVMTSCVTEDEPDMSGLAPGDALPLFSVQTSEGTTVSTESLKGKVAVIEFFNTSCSDCRATFPTLQQVWETVRLNPYVTLLAIARDESEASISSYWKENGLTIPYSPQSGREVYSLFAKEGIPRLYIADRNGIIRSVYLPDQRPTVSEILKEINSLTENAL